MRDGGDRQAIPARFADAYRAIQQLARHDRYLGAFVFGSVARGEATDQSDLDVKVIAAEDNPCPNINHPVIGGVKLDLTFISSGQLREATDREIADGWRVPMLAESLLVFDKTGDLATLREWARRAEPRPVAAADHQLLQFLLFHVDDKARRSLDDDPASAALVMHMGLHDLLEIHYRLHGKWQLSSKRLLPDLRTWDRTLATLVEAFVAVAEVGPKFRCWTAMVEHIVAPLGGRQPIAENNCACAVCAEDLARLLEV